MCLKDFRLLVRCEYLRQQARKSSQFSLKIQLGILIFPKYEFTFWSKKFFFAFMNNKFFLYPWDVEVARRYRPLNLLIEILKKNVIDKIAASRQAATCICNFLFWTFSSQHVFRFFIIKKIWKQYKDKNYSGGKHPWIFLIIQRLRRGKI